MSRYKPRCVGYLFLSFLYLYVAAATWAGQCPGAHCSAVSEQINKICKSDGFSGNVVYVQMGNVYCYCNCSCLAYDTPVRVSSSSWRPIQALGVGDTVLTANSDKKWIPVPVAFSDGTSGNAEPLPYAVFLRTELGVSLIVTPDHPFLIAGEGLKRADRLTLEDRLVTEDWKPVRLTALGYGEYSGGIHNISTTTGAPGEDLWGHLLVTAGVISGDYYAQLYLVDKAADGHPLMGSAQYIAEHGELDLSFSTIVGSAKDTRSRFSFTPYKRFTPPPGAVPLLPDHKTTAAPGMLRELDDTIPLEIAKYLVHNFRRFYPNVEYHIEWLDNTVNAYAWRQGGRRHVALLGGLIRHREIKVEGLGLVLAHELGHHYGGAPTYPSNGLSCEGQSDYWAALIGMREVWWGEEYLRQTIAGAEQLYRLFAFGVVSSLTPEEEKEQIKTAGSCSHPPAACRRETYLAAVRAEPKPTCAGFMSVGTLSPGTLSYCTGQVLEARGPVECSHWLGGMVANRCEVPEEICPFDSEQWVPIDTCSIRAAATSTCITVAQ